MKGDANNSVHFVLEQYPPSLYILYTIWPCYKARACRLAFVYAAPTSNLASHRVMAMVFKHT